MADEAREYLRAAQQAEVRGDRSQAVELLAKAATVYRQRGQNERALQMLRHATRLDPARTDLADQVRRMEWMPDRPFLRAVSEAEEAAEEALALKPLEDLALSPVDELVDLAESSQKQLIERGPTLADPALNAWCSFCCKPKTEVGELIAGPAGAYVCQGCVREAGRLLGVVPPNGEAQAAPSTAGEATNEPAGGGELRAVQSHGRESAVAPGEADVAAGRESSVAPGGARVDPGGASAVAPPEAAGANPHGTAVSSRAPRGPIVDPVGQAQAVSSIEAALKLGVESVLLLGPEGSGKTAHLRDLERRGLGIYVESPAALSAAPADLPALVDHLDEASPADWEQLGRVLRAKREAPVLLAMRGLLPPAELMLARDGQELPLYPTATLAQATGGRIPNDVLEQVQIAISFSLPSRNEVVEVARRLAALRAAELDATDELLETLAELAQGSGRLGHELWALLGRLPSGEWTARRVEPGSPTKQEKPEKEKKPARRRKKTEEG